MAKGRRRKPTKLHKLNGNPSKINFNKERQNEPEFEVPDGVPKPPKSISIPKRPKPAPNGEISNFKLQKYEDAKRFTLLARREWNRLAPELYEKGLLTNVSLRVFEVYCVAIAKKLFALEKAYEEGFTDTTSSGRTIQSCWVQMQKDGIHEIEKCGYNL